MSPKTDDISVTYDGGDVPMKVEDDSADEKEYPCILKVTDGKKTKFSTHVSERYFFLATSSYPSQRYSLGSFWRA